MSPPSPEPNAPCPARSRRSDRTYVAVLALAVVLHSGPTLNRDISLSDDWLRLAALNAAARQTVLEWRALPFRSAYFGGGYPTIAEPEDPALSPFFLLSLLFGEVYGLKLRALCCVLLGALGMYHFCRRVLNFAPQGSFAAGGLLAFASWFHARHLGGNVTEMQYAFTPLLLWLLLRKECAPRHTIAATALLAVVVVDGKLVWASLVLYTALVGLAWAGGVGRLGWRRMWRVPARVVAVAALSLLLAGAKVLPMARLLHERGSLTDPQVYPHARGYSNTAIGGYAPEGIVQSMLSTSYTPGENRAKRLTVGRVALAMALCGLVLGWRALWWLAAPGLLCGWLMMSHHAPVDLFRVLWSVPPFGVMTFPNKYFDFFVLFTLCVLCGLVVSRVAQLSRPRLAWLAPLLALALLWEPLRASGVIARGMFCETLRGHVVRKPRDFFHVRSALEARSGPRLPRSEAYFNFLANVGTLDWFTPLPMHTKVRPRLYVWGDGNDRPNPSYRGEIEARPDGNRAWLVLNRPNRLVLIAEMASPGLVVINQNHSRWWSSDRGEVGCHDDRLALRLREPGTYTITLRYLPWDFMAGLGVSALAAAGLALFAWRSHRLKRSARAAASAERGSSGARSPNARKASSARPQ